jgi:hypothetical protein
MTTIGGNARSQASKLRAQLFTDVFGRQFGGTIEIASGVATGPLHPVGWAPAKTRTGFPLLVPSQYHRFDPITKPGHLGYDLAAWQSDVVAAEAKWNENLIHLAKTMFPEMAGQLIETPTARLIELVGPKPMVASVLIEAMMDGNRYVLGLDPRMPQWAVPFCLPEPTVGRGALATAYPSAEDEDALVLVGDAPAPRGRK